MKYYFLIIGLLVSLTVKSQIEENAVTYNQNIEHRDNYTFPNTNIGKGSITFNFGVVYTPLTGKLAQYYKPIFGGGAVSLDIYHPNNLTLSLFTMETNALLIKDVKINNNSWTLKDTATFWSYGFSAGYSILNKVHWRINPFGGIVLSQTKLVSSNGNKYTIGARPSPIIGMNFSYKIINVKKEKQRAGPELAAYWGINARIIYVPFAVNKNEVPFSGGIWYLTIGLTLNMYGRD